MFPTKKMKKTKSKNAKLQAKTVSSSEITFQTNAKTIIEVLSMTMTMSAAKRAIKVKGQKV